MNDRTDRSLALTVLSFVTSVLFLAGCASGPAGRHVNFSNYDAERGRLMSATEVEVERPVVVLGWQTADRLFGEAIQPIDKVIQIEGVHFRVVGVSAKRGSLLGQSQDNFAIIPLGQFQQIFGSRRQLSMAVKPRDLAQLGVEAAARFVGDENGWAVDDSTGNAKALLLAA